MAASPLPTRPHAKHEDVVARWEGLVTLLNTLDHVGATRKAKRFALGWASTPLPSLLGAEAEAHDAMPLSLGGLARYVTRTSRGDLPAGLAHALRSIEPRALAQNLRARALAPHAVPATTAAGFLLIPRLSPSSTAGDLLHLATPAKRRREDPEPDCAPPASRPRLLGGSPPSLPPHSLSALVVLIPGDIIHYVAFVADEVASNRFHMYDNRIGGPTPVRRRGSGSFTFAEVLDGHAAGRASVVATVWNVPPLTAHSGSKTTRKRRRAQMPGHAITTTALTEPDDSEWVCWIAAATHALGPAGLAALDSPRASLLASLYSDPPDDGGFAVCARVQAGVGWPDDAPPTDADVAELAAALAGGRGVCGVPWALFDWLGVPSHPGSGLFCLRSDPV